MSVRSFLRQHRPSTFAGGQRTAVCHAASKVARAASGLRGKLRFTAPVSLGSTRIGPLLAGFMQQNLGLALHVTLDGAGGWPHPRT